MYFYILQVIPLPPTKFLLSFIFNTLIQSEYVYNTIEGNCALPVNKSECVCSVDESS